MAVQRDRRAPEEAPAEALEALADAVAAAARADRLSHALHALVAAAARGAAADVALARVVDPESGELVARAVVAGSAAIAAELEGSRVPAEALGDQEVSALADAPEPVLRAARLAGASRVLVLPVTVAGERVGTLELFREEGGFSAAERAAARAGAAHLALALRAFGRRSDDEDKRAAERVARLAGDALAAAAHAERCEEHVVRLARALARASQAVLWRPRDGGLAVAAQAGSAEAPDEDARAAAERALGSAAGPVEELDGRIATSFRLGEPPLGVLQLVFAREQAPPPDELERLAGFAVRAAHALRAAERTRRVTAELEQARALLDVVGRASAQLSLAYTLKTAIEQIAELAGAERLAVYLREEGQLVAAAGRGLAGPHARVAEALLDLALGPFRGRGILALEDASAEPRLAPVVNALEEAGIEAALALPLLVADDVIGMLAVYPPRGHAPGPNETALLAALAGQLAVAVQNARLHEEATRLGAELEEVLASERESARRLRALYEISRSFAENLSVDLTLDAIAKTVVEHLEVDAAVIRVPDARRELLVPCAVHVAEERLAQPVRSILFRPHPFRAEWVEQVYEARRPLLLDATTSPLLAPFLEKGSTAAVVPIATPDEVLASLTLLSLRPDRPIEPHTIDAAATIAAQAALALENARLYQQRKEFADAMQRSLLPQVRPQVEGVDVGEVYAPSARVDIGGDLYDYVALEDGRLAVVVGDVTGHGIDAAADMAMAKFVFRTLVREHARPAEFLAAANDVVVSEIPTGKFITLLYLLIDPRTGDLACAGAGHPAPRLVSATGEVRPLAVRGLALGIASPVRYDELHERLEPGASIVLYTDGVIEARRDSELYGMERLDALLGRRHALSAEDLAASVIQSARRFTGGDLSDDCAVVVVKRVA